MVSSRPRLRRRIAAALAVAITAILPAASGAQAARAAVRSASAGATGGYWMVASDGGIFSFGSATFYGSTGNIKLNQPIVGIAATPSGKGYWMVATDGGIFSFGDAQFFGSTGNVKLNKPIVGMASTPSGKGYWLVASDGGIFSFGDAQFFGSTGNVKLNKPIVGMASSPSGKGYWFVASDGGIFSFGDAGFHGSTGDVKPARPITSMAASPSGKGYWLTASDGSVFNFGDARFFGAAPSRPAPAGGRTVAAMVPNGNGSGYWQASTTGELLAYGGAADLGGLSGALAKPIVGMTVAPEPAIGVAGTPAGPEPSGTVTTTPPATATTGTTSITGPAASSSTTTTTTTTTTGPPGPGYSGPMAFSSTAKVSWGTLSDLSHPSVNSTGETTYPYAQKVLTITEIGDRVYIGGEFTDLAGVDANRAPSGLGTAYLAELDRNGFPVSGSAFNATVRLDGPVRALFRSPDGRRLYVGGEFNRVNGEIRRRLVALDPSTGQIDRSFSPPEPSGYVGSITQYGSRLYIAGGFKTLGLVSQPQLAALDAATGALDGGFVPPPRYPGRFEGHTGKRVDDPVTTADQRNGVIASLLVTPDGKHLLVSGSFLHFGTDHIADPEHRHSGLVSLDPATGNLTLWQPTWGANSSRPVFGMTLYPGDPKAIGINAPTLVFTAAGGGGGRLVAWTPGGKTGVLWRGGVDGDALSVAATKERVYLVGHFDHVVPDPDDDCLKVRDLGNGNFGVSCPDGIQNRHLAAFDVRGDRDPDTGKNTGKAIIDTSFTAQADTPEGPYAAFIGANQMYVGGNFSKLSDTAVASRVKQPGFAIYPGLP